MRVLEVDGELVVYSPTHTGPDVFERLDALGRVRTLVAPNHYHHLSLAAFRERYPDALAVASARAIPRLRAQGHAGLSEIEAATLPAGVRAHVAEGTRTGETFLSFDDATGITLCVCDAWFHVPELRGGLEADVLRLTQTGPGLKVGRTFKYAALGDRRAYAAWAQRTVRELAPTRVLFSHGAPLEGPDVVPALLTAMRERLG